MKLLKLFALVLAFTMFIVACGNKESEEKKAEEQAEEQLEETEKAVMDAFEKMTEGTVSGEELSCDEYLDKFEKWADKYIEMINKVKKNPTDATLLTDYSKLALEYTSWATQWQNQIKCSEDEAFVKRYDEITNRIQEAAEGLQ